MEPITAIITALDWLISHEAAKGETIPNDVLAARTRLRRELVQQAHDAARGDDGDDDDG